MNEEAEVVAERGSDTKRASRRRARRRRRSRAWPAKSPKTSTMRGVMVWPRRRASRYCAPTQSGWWPRMSESSRGSVFAKANNAPAAGTGATLTSGDERDNLELHELMVTCGSGVVHHAVRAGTKAAGSMD
eukprot:6201757-Pleurochrysis_carterae.AAC.1